MQEEVENKTVNLAVKTTKFTVEAICKGVSDYIEERKRSKLSGDDKGVKRGKQSVKDLLKDGQNITSIPITDDGIKDFQKICKKYGVDFAVVKDKSENPPTYTVFFKAKDADAFTSILKEYSAKQVDKAKRRERPSILDKLKKFKDAVVDMTRKNKEKRKERER